MTPAEKMDEIVRALESLTEELAAEIEGRYASTKDHPAMERRYRADMEDVKVGRRAITLARELRENAVEGYVDSVVAQNPGEIMSCDGEVTVWIDDNGLSVPALLITDPTP